MVNCTSSEGTRMGSWGWATYLREGPLFYCLRQRDSYPSAPASGILWCENRTRLEDLFLKQNVFHSSSRFSHPSEVYVPVLQGRGRRRNSLGLRQQPSVRPKSLPISSPAFAHILHACPRGQLGVGNLRSSSSPIPVNITVQTWCDTLDSSLLAPSFTGKHFGTSIAHAECARPMRPMSARPDMNRVLFADLVCVRGNRRSRKAKSCSCGDYHSFAVMDNGDIFGWSGVTRFSFERRFLM